MDPHALLVKCQVVGERELLLVPAVVLVPVQLG